jgi:cell division protein FtsQ
MKTKARAVRRQPASKPSRLWHFAVPAVGVALVAALLTVLVSYSKDGLRSAYPIRYVRIEGKILELKEEALSSAIAPLAKNGFFNVDLAAIENTARSFAWLGDVQGVRQSPDTLGVKISEHRPAARWNRMSLLSDRGVRFTPENLAGFESLTGLFGPDGQEQTVFAVLQSLNDLCRSRKVHVSKLTLTARQSWTATLSDGKDIVIGRQDPVASMKSLLKWLPELERRHLASVKKVDLRYRNGFTVVWGQETAGDSITRRTDAHHDRQASVFSNHPEVHRQVAALQW